MRVCCAASHALGGPAAGPRTPTRPRGRRWYYEANSGQQAQSALYSAATPALDGNATLVLDPNTLAADGSVSASGYAFSWDGALMAYRTSRCARALPARAARGLGRALRMCAAEGQKAALFCARAGGARALLSVMRVLC